MGKRGHSDWTRAHQVERLVQLRMDVDSALGRYATQCYRRSLVVPEQADEWLRRMEMIDELRALADADMSLFIQECG